MQHLNVMRLQEDAVLPTRGTQQSAGLDLYACLDQAIFLEPGDRAVIPTGIAAEIPGGWCGLVFARSGLGIKHGIIPSNAVGVVDSDYRGEILVGLTNHGSETFIIFHGDRIAQLVLMEVGLPEVIECDSLSPTGRGDGGFGSTGR